MVVFKTFSKRLKKISPKNPVFRIKNDLGKIFPITCFFFNKKTEYSSYQTWNHSPKLIRISGT